MVDYWAYWALGAPKLHEWQAITFLEGLLLFYIIKFIYNINISTFYYKFSNTYPSTSYYESCFTIFDKYVYVRFFKKYINLKSGAGLWNKYKFKLI